jgi:hypothetical protein
MIYAPLLVKLACAGRKMHAMAYEVYYGGKTFVFAKATIDASCPKIFRFPISQMGHLLRRVELRAYIPTSLPRFDQQLKLFCWEEDDFNPLRLAPEMLTLVRSRRAQRHGSLSLSDDDDVVEEPLNRQDTLGPLRLVGRQKRGFSEVHVWGNKRDQHTTWQKHLSSLKELTLSITVDMCLDERVRKAFQELPDYTETFLRANNVRVNVTVPGCAVRAKLTDKMGQPFCDGQCGKLHECVFDGMIKH